MIFERIKHNQLRRWKTAAAVFRRHGRTTSAVETRGPNQRSHRRLPVCRSTGAQNACEVTFDGAVMIINDDGNVFEDEPAAKNARLASTDHQYCWEYISNTYIWYIYLN